MHVCKYSNKRDYTEYGNDWFRDLLRAEVEDESGEVSRDQIMKEGCYTHAKE